MALQLAFAKCSVFVLELFFNGHSLKSILQFSTAVAGDKVYFTLCHGHEEV